MNSVENYAIRYLEPKDVKDLDQYNALLRYTFQVTEDELTATGWKDEEIKQSKFPVLERAVFRNALAWEEYWRRDEDDTNVAVYYNTKDKPCGFMVYLIKNDIMHIKETIRPYAMGRIIDIESFLQDYPCDPDGGTLYIELEIEDRLLLWNNRSFRLCFFRWNMYADR